MFGIACGFWCIGEFNERTVDTGAKDAIDALSLLAFLRLLLAYVFCFPRALLEKTCTSSLSELLCFKDFSPLRALLFGFVSKVFALKLDLRDDLGIFSTSDAAVPAATCSEHDVCLVFSLEESTIWIVDSGSFARALSFL